MKALLDNQECRIDNHTAGQIINGLKGLHIHKTYKKDKTYSKAEIRIPLDGERVEWDCTGRNSDKLKRECEKVLKNPEKNRNFVNVVVDEMYRFNNIGNNPNLTESELNEMHKEIAENVLTRGFLVDNLSFKESKTKNVYGNPYTYNYFESDNTNYKTFVGKSRWVFEGEDKHRQD